MCGAGWTARSVLLTAHIIKNNMSILLKPWQSSVLVLLAERGRSSSAGEGQAQTYTDNLSLSTVLGCSFPISYHQPQQISKVWSQFNPFSHPSSSLCLLGWLLAPVMPQPFVALEGWTLGPHGYKTTPTSWSANYFCTRSEETQTLPRGPRFQHPDWEFAVLDLILLPIHTALNHRIIEC